MILHAICRSLVAGTICGEILVYSSDLSVPASQSMMQSKSGRILKHMQTLLVCGSSVQCLAWSKDGRYEDDGVCFHVLELKFEYENIIKLESLLGESFIS